MATNPRPVSRTQGQVGVGGQHIGNGVWYFTNDGVPTAGTSGTGAGWAGPGSQCTDYTNAKLYINTGTAASPTWTVVGTQS